MDNRKTIKVFTVLDDREIKVGAIIPYLQIETEYDVITDKRISSYVFTWNWSCWGAGKQRRGRGNFLTSEAAKKALLKVCPFHEHNLLFKESV